MKYSKTSIDFSQMDWTNIDNVMEIFGAELALMQNALGAIASNPRIELGWNGDRVLTADEANACIIAVGGSDDNMRLLVPSENGIFMIMNMSEHTLTVQDIYENGATFIDSYEMSLCLVSEGGGVMKLTSYSMFEMIDARVTKHSVSGPLDIISYGTFRIDSSTGELEVTLVDEFVGRVGREVRICMCAAGNNAVLTPTNFVDGATITFDAVGESATLRWNGEAWELIALSGATIGT